MSSSGLTRADHDDDDDDDDDEKYIFRFDIFHIIKI